jgi:drug/metabolite transporter (DMT)-like permease
VSQFSILLYIGQAAILSLFVIWKNPETFSELFHIPQSIYFWMGSLDSGSSTLGGIAGAFCPGEVQTILNQMVIPLTMISSYLFLGTTFERYQLLGSGLILTGAVIASSDYLFSSSTPLSSSSVISGHGMSLTVSVTLYLISVIPSALSNIYKEGKMKERDLNEFHTSTIVSFWQLWVGFAFLPLMSLPSLGHSPLLPHALLTNALYLCLSPFLSLSTPLS